MGHRLVEFFAGPRTVQIVSDAMPQAATAAAGSSRDSCGTHNKAFVDCLNHSQSDITRCQFYLDILNQCRRGSSGNAGLAAAATIA
ncbi:hypothetical protein ZWY2020_051725 [Hordeum vulgare]|nr:hypothetical protein ZWY2020_046630 [Hordeum vulgare]KAI4992308.1 hypothetical protein ZWY2020_051725 [Hordeum vulgare]